MLKIFFKKKPIIYCVLIFLSVTLINCIEKPKKTVPTVNKITKAKLEIVFEYEIEPFSINDYLIPVTELISSYSEFSISTYENDNNKNLVGYENYLDLSKKDITMNNENLIDYIRDKYHWFTFFHYDKKNKLIKKIFKDKLSKGQGSVEFIYNSNYSKMDKVGINEYNPLIREIKDTLRSYEFNINGKPTKIISYGNKAQTHRIIEYYNNGLIKSIFKKIHIKEQKLDINENALYTYTYNNKGDWTGLTMVIKNDNTGLEHSYFTVRDLKN